MDFNDLDSVLEEYYPLAEEYTYDPSQDLFSDSDDDVIGPSDSEVDVTHMAARYVRLSQENDENNLSDSEENDERPLSQLTPDILRTELTEKLNSNCGCHKQCFLKLNVEELYHSILNLRDMMKNEKEMLIMGTMTPKSTSAATKSGKRRKVRYVYKYTDIELCKSAFLVAYDLGKKQLANIITHINTHGAEPRVHKATSVPKAWGLKLQDTELVIRFLKSYATENGLPQPATPRASDGEPPILLPSYESKLSLHKKYVQSLEAMPEPTRTVGLSSFKDIWLGCVPHPKFVSPRDDVCSQCELLRKAIADSRTDSDKLTNAEKLASHIRHAKEEKFHYNKNVQDSRKEFKDHVPGNEMKQLHCTFDFALHVTLPHHTRTMGPLYFWSLKRVQIFGICYEGASVQYNYLIGEDETIGVNGTSTHGPNAVLSMLDHCIQTNNYGERILHFHADNCPGQNKNYYVLSYFLWRTIVGLDDHIYLSFQLPGHTKCLVDAGHGLNRKMFRRSDSDCMYELKTALDRSAVSNRTILYKLEGSEQPTWEWRDWKAFIDEYFKRFVGIQQFYHFRFDRNEPGKVFAKVRLTDEEKEVMLARDVAAVPAVRPPIMTAAGITYERQKYLYEHVRSYVRPLCKDILCPEPVREGRNPHPARTQPE